MNSQNLQAILNQALQLEQQGALSEALRLFQQLDALSPDNQRVLLKLVRINRLLGDISSAEHFLMKVQSLPNLDPKLNPLMLQETGSLFFVRQRFAEAIEAFKQLIRDVPDYAPGYFQLGEAYQESNLHSEAITAFEQCQKLYPDENIDVSTKIAASKAQTGDTSGALSLYDAVLEKHPEHFPAWFGRAMVHYTLGDFEQSSNDYRECIKARPDYAPAYQQLMDTRKFESPDDEDIQILKERLNQPNLDDFSKERLHFGLGKAYNDCKSYDDAYRHFEAANQLKYNRLPKFSQSAWKQYIDSIIETFTPDFIKEHQQNRNPQDFTPTLIVGMPRSGSTLVEHILSVHPDVTGAGELTYLAEAAEKSFSPYPNIDKLKDLGALQKLSQGYREYLTQFGETQIIIDKYPSNYLFVGLCHLAMPDAKFIYSARSPLDICLSIYFQDFAYGNRYGNRWEDLIFYYQQHERLIEHWSHLLGPDVFHQIKYEDLLDNQEDITHSLSVFCNLDWHKELLEHQDNERQVTTFSAWQVRQPIYKTSKERWRNYEQHLTELLEAFPPAQ